MVPPATRRRAPAVTEEDDEVGLPDTSAAHEPALPRLRSAPSHGDGVVAGTLNSR